MATLKLSKENNILDSKVKTKEFMNKDYPPQGYAGSLIEESRPDFFKHGPDKVIVGMNNSFIVLGRDREGYYGGKGYEPFPRCGAIDIVAGLGGSEGENIKDGNKYAPSFFKDAARLYISQRSDVDNYFGLAKGSFGPNPNNKSCAVLKSDHTRIIGREHVKIIAGKAKIKAQDGERNSLGLVIEQPGTIDLIAGNYDGNGTLQPLVKGDNLIKFLKDLIEEISALNSRVQENQIFITKLANYSLAHMHPGPGAPSPMMFVLTSDIVDSFAKITTCASISSNLAVMEKLTYLNPLHDSYINSKVVKTT